jgi:predicted nucleotidyltransferase
MSEYPDFLQKAIHFCINSSKEYTNYEAIVACLKTQDSMIHSRFRYSIARDFALFLYNIFGDIIINFKLYGSTMEYNAGIYSDIDLIIQVKSANEKLFDTIKSINQHLSEKYYQMIEEAPSEWSYLLDTHIINNDPNEQVHPSKAYLEYIISNDSVEIY